MVDIEHSELQVGDEVAISTSGQVRRGRVLKIGKLKNGNSCAHIEYYWTAPDNPTWPTMGVFSSHRSILLLEKR